MVNGPKNFIHLFLKKEDGLTMREMMITSAVGLKHVLFILQVMLLKNLFAITLFRSIMLAFFVLRLLMGNLYGEKEVIDIIIAICISARMVNGFLRAAWRVMTHPLLGIHWYLIL
jgi:hypothetical protein